MSQDERTDFIFMFVNPYDPAWRAEYAKYVGGEPTADRRHNKSPRLLRYCFRSVAKNMPWIGRMHMVVAAESQVPSWVNRETVNVVTHGQIIPEDQLPTFNTMTIAKFLCFTPGLSRKYVMSCDDWYAVNPISRDMMFSQDGQGLCHASSSALREFRDEWPYGGISISTYAKFQDYCRRNGLGEQFDRTLKANGRLRPVFLHNFVPCDKDEARKVLQETGVLGEKYGKVRGLDNSCTLEMLCWLNMLRTPGGAGASTVTVYNEPGRDAIWNSAEHFKRRMDAAAKGARCLCVNSHTPWTKNTTAEWFESRFPDKCKYEA